jgi:hypothetical protein
MAVSHRGLRLLARSCGQMSRGGGWRAGVGLRLARNTGPLVRLVPSGSRRSRGSRWAVPVPQCTHSVWPPLERTRVLGGLRGRAARRRARGSPRRARRSRRACATAFSRAAGSRGGRADGRSFAWAGRWCGRRARRGARSRRAAPGAGQRLVLWHQASQELTAARLRFQVGPPRVNARNPTFVFVAVCGSGSTGAKRSPGGRRDRGSSGLSRFA